MSLIDELERLNALRRSGALSDSEFQSAKARLLSGPQPPAAPAAAAPGRRMELEAELARVDREFEMVRQECLIFGRHGHSREPSEGTGVAVGLFSVLWVGMAIFMTAKFAEHGGAMALFPLGIGIVGVVSMISGLSDNRRKLGRLTAARAQWQQDRSEILARIAAL